MGLLGQRRDDGDTAVEERRGTNGREEIRESRIAPTKAQPKMSRNEALSLVAVLTGEPLIDDRVREGMIESGAKLIKPDDMTYGDAIAILERRRKEEETEIAINEQIDAFPLDGARALALAIEEQFGVAFQETSWSFFGPSLPQRISVRTPSGEIFVPWGEMSLPGMKDTKLATGISRHLDGMAVFQINTATLKKHEKKIRKLLARTRELVQEKSFYRGHALKVDFTKMDQAGYSPEFMGTESKDGSILILNEDTEAMFRGSVLTPIEKTAICRAMKIPLRRGILLEGPFGTGKTLSAQAVAKACIANGWTFIYVNDSIHLPAARKLAKRYQPAVIFAEDLDQILVKEAKEVENVRNALDAVDGKNDEIIVLCTTNNLEKLKKARGMLRPGRFDALIHVGYPDAGAAERLLRHYAGKLLAEEESLAEASRMLEGSSAAMIRECVERAKLWSISHGTHGTLHEKDLVFAAKELKAHIDVMADDKPVVISKEEQLGTLVRDIVASGAVKSIEELKVGVNEQLDHFHQHLVSVDRSLKT